MIRCNIEFLESLKLKSYVLQMLMDISSEKEILLEKILDDGSVQFYVPSENKTHIARAG